MGTPNTGLAAEYHVLSIPHRLGYDATLTVGNRKAVDIVVERPTGQVSTIDVKGAAGTTGWFVDNLSLKRPNHFIVFVSFGGRIQQTDTMPEVFIVPSGKVSRLTTQHPSGKKVAHPPTPRTRGAEYRDAWKQIVRGAR